MSPGVEFMTSDEDETDVGPVGGVTAAKTDVPEDHEAQAARKRLQAVAEHIRAESRAVRLTDPIVFLAEPFGLTGEQLAQVWTDMAASGEFADIVRTSDERTGIEWLHSEELITVPYAKLMLRSQADDPTYLITETVREESARYPRPTALGVFGYEPFNLRPEDVLAHVETISADETSSDIKTVRASNGAVYLYSDRHLTQERAQAWAERVEVEMILYP